MTTQTFTPGPWVHDDYQILAGGTVIANCTYGARNSNNANDARLIAAAPDLLKALQGWCEHLDGEPGGETDTFEHEELLMAAMRSAIAKAEGKKP